LLQTGPQEANQAALLVARSGCWDFVDKRRPAFGVVRHHISFSPAVFPFEINQPIRRNRNQPVLNATFTAELFQQRLATVTLADTIAPEISQEIFGFGVRSAPRDQNREQAWMVTLTQHSERLVIALDTLAKGQ